MKFYKYFAITLCFCFAGLQLPAQEIVKMTVVKSNNYGVVYTLPKTSIVVTAHGTKKTRKAGEFYQYAERYLNVSSPIVKNETIYTLTEIEARTKGIPDTDNSYLVEFKASTVAPFVSLTKEGLICAINADAELENAQPTQREETASQSFPDPRLYLSEEILRAGSSAKQAELIAKQIYRLRESKTNILTGEADNMPPDGNAYRLIMEQIEEQEKALTSMFVGMEVEEPFSQQFVVVPEEDDITKRVIFRFSKKLGIVSHDDLSGAPVYLSLKANEPIADFAPLSAKEQKALDAKFAKGVIYNVPAKGTLTVEYNNQTLIKKQYDIVQFGTQEVLTPQMMDNKKNPIKVIFYPELGAIKQIIQ